MLQFSRCNRRRAAADDPLETDRDRATSAKLDRQFPTVQFDNVGFTSMSSITLPLSPKPKSLSTGKPWSPLVLKLRHAGLRKPENR